MDEEGKADLVHLAALTETERPPDKPGEPLPEGVVPPLDVVGLARLLAAGAVPALRDDLSVRLPEVREAQARPVGVRDAVPQAAARPLSPVADRVGDDLPRPAAQGQPDPLFVPSMADERPQLIEFQAVPGGGRNEGSGQGGQPR